jgi:enediyne biosynthesis protein E4
VVVNRRENVALWRNLGSGRGGQASPMGHWVAARVSQPNPNVDAVGAWVQVRADGHVIEREITVGGGHAGGQLGWLHFGLGEAVRAEIRVIWPDGEEGPWLSIAADQFVTVDRGTKEARSWLPPASP